MTRALFATAFDSQLKWCVKIREEFEARGIICRIVVPNTRNALSDRQITETGVERVERMTWQEMMQVAFSNDIFVSSLSGPSTKRISMELDQQAKERGLTPPLLVSGWVGVIIEKLIAGYLDRFASDVIAVNSNADMERFVDVAQELGLPTDNLVLTGLPFMSNEVKPTKTGPVKTVLFADQPTVPEAGHERLYVYKRLIDYAKCHPDRDVVLKPRHKLGEDTFHAMKFHPEDLLKDEILPPNFRIGYEPISDSLSSTDLLLTFSSTAAIEAIAEGCRVGLILDLGIHEKYGNPVFLKSGLLRTFDQLETDNIGTLNGEWFKGYFPCLDQSPATIIADRVSELLKAEIRPTDAIKETSLFFGAREFQAIEGDLRKEVKATHATPFQQRLASYDPVRRSIIKMGDMLLPSSVAKPLDSALKKIGIF